MSDWYTRIVSGALFPLHERLKGHETVRRLSELERSQWWPRERLESYRRERLRAFFTRVGAKVPYYRELGLDPSSRLELLPFLTKDIIRKNLQRLKSEDAQDLSLYNTGGSTGEPLQFYLGKDS